MMAFQRLARACVESRAFDPMPCANSERALIGVNLDFRGSTAARKGETSG
jgi:hypothetical protein